MKFPVRPALAVLSLSLAVLMVAGCSKKAAKTETPDSKVESISVTKPPPSRGLTGGETPKKASDQSPQLIALRGEDIPISEPPSLEFIDPSPEDRKILKNIYFDFDRSNIKPEYQTVLEGVAQWLRDRPVKQLLIEGHCDERGTNEYNLALGERRSLSIRRYLVGLGIAPDRLHTISYGEEKPSDPGHSEAAWSQNRRGEFKVSAN